jgi:hypothetical protein
MATNLRLHPEAEEALRAESQRSGRSQQEIVRTALDRYLGLVPGGAASDLDELISTGQVRPPRVPYRRPHRRVSLPPGMTTADLLDRDDRF